MAGCKLETVFTVDTDNNCYRILSGADPNAVIGSVTAGSYFMGSHHTDYGSFCAELYRSLNAYGPTCATAITCVSVSVSSTTKKMTIVMSGSFRLQPFQTAEADENTLHRYLGFNGGLPAPLSGDAATQTGDAQVAFVWLGDDGSDSLQDASVEQNVESRRSKVIRTESIPGHVISHDLVPNGLASRSLRLSFVPSERMFGPKYGQGYASLNLNYSFESGATADANYWTRGSSVAGSAWWPTAGTNSAWITGGWPAFASNTSQTGSYHFELGDKASAATTGAGTTDGNYVQIHQYIDLGGYSGFEFDLAYDDTNAKSFKFEVLRGTTVLFSGTSTATSYTIDRANIPINLDGQTGYQKIIFRLSQVGAGSKTLPKCAIDNIRFRTRSNQAFAINESLEALWINAKAGKRIRYYPDASQLGKFREYILSQRSADVFNPEPINGVLDRWNLTLELEEYVA